MANQQSTVRKLTGSVIHGVATWGGLKAQPNETQARCNIEAANDPAKTDFGPVWSR